MTGVVSVTDLLSKAQPGDDRSMSQLLPLVYEELRRLAASYLDRHADAGGRSHTLQPTALVHEAFVKMVGADRAWSGRDHFMAVAATAMRQVLVDHARRAGADKRGGDRRRVDVTIDALDAGRASPGCDGLRVVELDELLSTLAGKSARAARVAELRLFGGLDWEQVARVLDISPATAQRDWLVARAWLASRLQERPDA